MTRDTAGTATTRCSGGRWWAWLLLLVCGLVLPATAASDAPLADAIEHRDLGAARALIAQHADVNAPQPDGATALHWAAHWNDLEAVDLLLAAGANANAVNDLGVPPLSLAAGNGMTAVVERLLRAGADPNVPLRLGETPLMTASRAGSAGVVAALIAGGARVDAVERTKGQTGLMWAASEGHADVVRVLLANGADPRVRTTRGATALLLAARAGDVDSARALVAAGADVNEQEPILPLPPGADANEVLPGGSSALLIASASLNATSGFEYRLTVKPSGHEALALFLVEQGANPDKTDTIGTTPLHAAAQTGKRKLVNALLARGANPNPRLTKAPPPLRGDFVSYAGYVGATPLWLAAAARTPDTSIMRELIAAGADPAQAVQDGSTALMAAVGMVQNDARLADESSAVTVVRLLLEQGVDINAARRNGQTALHGAARAGWNTIVQLLAEKGATLEVRDQQGRSPLDIAEDPIRPLESTASLLRKLAASNGTAASRPSAGAI